MYNINNDVILDGIDASDVSNIILETKKKAPRILLGNNMIALNKGLYDNFEVLTGRSLLSTLNKVVSEAGNVYILGQIAAEKFGENISVFSETVLSGIINSVMTVLMERLSLNHEYTGSLIELFKA